MGLPPLQEVKATPAYPPERRGRPYSGGMILLLAVALILSGFLALFHVVTLLVVGIVSLVVGFVLLAFAFRDVGHLRNR